MKAFATIVLVLLVLLVVVNAFQNRNLRKIAVGVCVPWWPHKTLDSFDQAVNKATHDTAGKLLGDWSIIGDDGYGGTILSYTFSAPNASQITNVEFGRCDGCVHTWVCPDPRCRGRNRIEHQGDGPWVAYAATDGAPAATMHYTISYNKVTARCIF